MVEYVFHLQLYLQLLQCCEIYYGKERYQKEERKWDPESQEEAEERNRRRGQKTSEDLCIFFEDKLVLFDG